MKLTHWSIPVGMYLFNVNNINTRTRFEICSKLTIKTPERRHSGVLIINFEDNQYNKIKLLLLTLSMYLPVGLENVRLGFTKISLFSVSTSLWAKICSKFIKKNARTLYTNVNIFDRLPNFEFVKFLWNRDYALQRRSSKIITKLILTFCTSV